MDLSIFTDFATSSNGSLLARTLNSAADDVESIPDNMTAVIDTSSPSADRYDEIREHVIVWSIIDGLLFILILCGNCLTIAAVQFSRRLRSVVSNLFILSLAISDLLVGLTIPYHLAFYLDVTLGESHLICIMKFFFNIVACCVSIWNLIAIAVDRYIAIVYPLHYSRWITRRVAVTVIIFGWISGAIIGVIPVFWNNMATSTECEFDEVLPPWYMAGIVTPVFSLIWLCMLTLYWRIWREAYKHAKQLRASITGLHDGGHSDWKSVQVVILILGCFTVCWLPYFVVATSQIFKFAANSSPTYYKAAFSLAMANSGMNPIIYAWKNRTFRRAFSHLLRCKAPDSRALIDDENARNNLKRKSSSLPPSMSAPPPTPNSIIIATPPPMSACSSDSYRRSSLHRFHYSSVTAFPLPPPPPSPQSPQQHQSMETIVVTSTGSAVMALPPSYIIHSDPALRSPSALTKCCLKVVDLNDANAYSCDCDAGVITKATSGRQRGASHETGEPGNNEDDHRNHRMPLSTQYLHPHGHQWHLLNQRLIDDDLSKGGNGNLKPFGNNSFNELFLHKLTNNSPAESIVSAPLTPTGNLIVNILENLEHHQHTETLNRKNYRNSTNCILRNDMTTLTTMTTTTTTMLATASPMPTPSIASINSITATVSTAAAPIISTLPTSPTLARVANCSAIECVIAMNNNNDSTEAIVRCAPHCHSMETNRIYCGGRSYSKSSSAPQSINCWSD